MNAGNQQLLESGFNTLIKKYSRLTIQPEARNVIQSSVTPVRYTKGAILIQAGQTQDVAYYLIQGAVRSYHLKDGIEVCSWFAFENEFVGSLENYFGRPSRETVEAIEDCVLLAVRLRDLKLIRLENADVANFIGSIIEEYAAFMEERVAWLQLSTAMERFEYVMKYEPHLFQRVSLTHIASYLGISRETLSRLRGR